MKSHDASGFGTPSRTKRSRYLSGRLMRMLASLMRGREARDATALDTELRSARGGIRVFNGHVYAGDS